MMILYVMKEGIVMLIASTQGGRMVHIHGFVYLPESHAPLAILVVLLNVMGWEHVNPPPSV